MDAGLNYYNKVLTRNKLLRQIIGEGMEYYIQVSETEAILAIP